MPTLAINPRSIDTSTHTISGYSKPRQGYLTAFIYLVIAAGVSLVAICHYIIHIYCQPYSVFRSLLPSDQLLALLPWKHVDDLFIDTYTNLLQCKLYFAYRP
jgi:hypothetical protein